MEKNVDGCPVIFQQLLLFKFHGKCFQITRKTMAVPILKITLTKCHLPYLSCLWKVKWWKQNFLWSNPTKLYVFCRFQQREILSFCRQGFINILFCKLQQRYLDLYLKNNFLKNFRVISLMWALVLFFFLNLVPDIISCSW